MLKIGDKVRIFRPDRPEYRMSEANGLTAEEIADANKPLDIEGTVKKIVQVGSGLGPDHEEILVRPTPAYQAWTSWILLLEDQDFYWIQDQDCGYVELR